MSESAKIGWLKYFWLAHLAKPAHHRSLLRSVHHHKVRSIVHVGVGDGILATRMIDVAARNSTERVCYTGIDLFEGAGSGSLSLRNAHALLKSHGARVKLIPGDVYSALARFANELTDVDCLVLENFEGEALQRSWLYVPRMLHDSSVVYQMKTGKDGQPAFEMVDRAWIAGQVDQWHSRRAA